PSHRFAHRARARRAGPAARVRALPPRPLGRRAGLGHGAAVGEALRSGGAFGPVRRPVGVAASGHPQPRQGARARHRDRPLGRAQGAGRPARGRARADQSLSAGALLRARGAERDRGPELPGRSRSGRRAGKGAGRTLARQGVREHRFTVSPELAPARSPWLGLSAVCVGSFMATLDGSIVNLALPALHDQFHVGITSVEWVVTAYLLAVSASLLALGRLGDLWGHRRVFVGGLFGFAIGSALCAGSSSLGELVAARGLQGVGASAMVALRAAIITDLFPREMRGRALGVISSVVAAGLTAGPPLGGFLLQHLSWHWIFLVNVPVGLFGAIWALRILPERRQPLAGGFDLAGALWSALAMSALLGALDLAARGHARAIGLFFLGTALAAGGLFAQRGEPAAEPLVDPGLFRSRLFSAGIVATLLSYTAMFASTLLTPFYLAQVRHLPASTMGLVLTAVPVGVAGVGPAAGYLSDRIGSRGLCVS